MTLLTTEIHGHDQQDAKIVFAADQRISDGTRTDSAQRKIFRIPRLRAGIGFFGLAEVPQVDGTVPMGPWLTEAVAGATSTTLGDLAHELAQLLNETVPQAYVRQAPSGFHLCGFREDDAVEFWYIRNIDDQRVLNGLSRYEVREEFQRRDAQQLSPGVVAIYRNGDIRAHVLGWERIDNALGPLLCMPDFRGLDCPDAYAHWVRFKMETIARFYESFCRESIIGPPIDVFAIERTG